MFWTFYVFDKIIKVVSLCLISTFHLLISKGKNVEVIDECIYSNSLTLMSHGMPSMQCMSRTRPQKCTVLTWQKDFLRVGELFPSQVNACWYLSLTQPEIWEMAGAEMQYDKVVCSLTFTSKVTLNIAWHVQCANIKFQINFVNYP